MKRNDNFTERDNMKNSSQEIAEYKQIAASSVDAYNRPQPAYCFIIDGNAFVR
jgi:hypothetical protein